MRKYLSRLLVGWANEAVKAESQRLLNSSLTNLDRLNAAVRDHEETKRELARTRQQLRDAERRLEVMDWSRILDTGKRRGEA